MLPAAGMSKTLRNSLEFPSYVEAPCIYDAKDSRFREPRLGKPPSTKPSRVPPKPARIPPAAQQAGGRMPPMKKVQETYFGTVLGGKRMVPDNPQTYSNADTVIWGKDLDMSQTRFPSSWLEKDMFRGAAGRPTSEFVQLPPYCLVGTFADTVAENDTGFAYSSASYTRHGFSVGGR
jgi:hypothetical protein